MIVSTVLAVHMPTYLWCVSFCCAVARELSAIFPFTRFPTIARAGRFWFERCSGINIFFQLTWRAFHPQICSLIIWHLCINIRICIMVVLPSTMGMATWKVEFPWAPRSVISEYHIANVNMSGKCVLNLETATPAPQIFPDKLYAISLNC